MVAAKGKKKTRSTKTLEEKEAAENDLAGTQFSDLLTNGDAQLEDGVGLVADEPRIENLGEMPGEEGAKVPGVDNEDPSMPVTKPNGDDNKEEFEENTSEVNEIDDRDDLLVENVEEHFDYGEEGFVDKLYDASEKEASEEDDGDAEVSGKSLQKKTNSVKKKKKQQQQKKKK